MQYTYCSKNNCKGDRHPHFAKTNVFTLVTKRKVIQVLPYVLKDERNKKTFKLPPTQTLTGRFISSPLNPNIDKYI
jgi:hypothetical protein